MHRKALRGAATVGHVMAVTMVLVAAVLTLDIGPVSAHTGFELSDPADGATLDAPVSEIMIVFTGAATPSGEGFVVLDPSGGIRQPDEIVAGPDGRTWTLGFDPPLAGGEVGVRWTAQAPDAHPISGAFSFTAGEAPADPPATTSTTSGSDLDRGSDPGSDLDRGSDPGSDLDRGSDPGSDLDRGSDPGSDLDRGSDPGSDPDSATDLDVFLGPVGSGPGSAGSVGGLGRLVGFAGVMVGIGSAVFAAIVLGGHRRDRDLVLRVVQLAALAVVAGALIELIAQVAIVGRGWSDVLDPGGLGAVAGSSFGLAVALRGAAGLSLLVVSRLSGSGQGPGTIAAVVALLISFAFDGHTVTEGNRWLTSAADIVHVGAASIWGGGVVALAIVLWRRRAEDQALDGLDLAVRFSAIAGAALGAAGLAGSTLAVIVLDGVAQLWETPWGRVLMAKLLAVGVAAAIGGYNHFVVIPWMSRDVDARGDGPADGAPPRLRNTVGVEAVLMLVVIALTAILVGSSARA